MKNMTFDETKKVELDILLYVSRFCDEHNLKYFLAYGTLIGAVRHNGFIPWDDDIDIQMPRDDYNKLIEIFNEYKGVEHIQLISPEDKISRHTFVKIVDTRTVKVESNVDYKKGQLGVDIDIFPIDGQPDSEEEFSTWYKKLNKIYELYVFNIIKAKGSIKKIVGVPLIKIFFNKKILRRKAKRLHDKYPFNSSTYVGAIESAFNSRGNRVKKEYYDDFTLLNFEGYQLKAPIGYDYILTKMYGDYMKLPEREKQITHHSNNTFWKEN